MEQLTTPCIISPYAVGHNGYAVLKHGNNYVRHHRLAYCLAANVPLASIASQVVMHKCDVRNCINPDHLVLGTQQDNIEDMNSKQRRNDAVGVCSSRAKLSEAAVLDIRKQHAAGRHGCPTLAKLFNVAPGTIYAIVARQTWTHI